MAIGFSSLDEFDDDMGMGGGGMLIGLGTSTGD